MAKSTGNKGGGGGGNSSIRFIMLEANIPSGDLTQITHAISNALRQPASQQPRLIAGSMIAPAASEPSNGDAASADEMEVPQEVFAESGEARPAKPARARRYKSPDVVNVDLTSGDVPFATFAKEKNPKNDSKRFLTVMAWFKNHRDRDAIGINEVYTAFRSKGVDWPYGIADYDGVFRGLVQRKLATRKDKGQYAINQIGEASIDTQDD